VRRRTFIAGIGSAAVWPMVVRAQQAVPVVGYLNSGAEQADVVDSFRQGLAEHGYVVGRNVDVIYAFADNQPERLMALTADLVKRHVTVIAASGGPQPGLAAKAATTTIPIVFETGLDPVRSGLVPNLNHPGGNVTGVNSLIAESWWKQLDLIAKVLPSSRLLAMLYTGFVPGRFEQLQQEARVAADKIDRKVALVTATAPEDLDELIPRLARQGVDGLTVTASAFPHNHRDKLAALTARHAIPTIYPFRENVEAGGLISYGIDIQESFKLMGSYVGRVLNGERPADLPVQQASRFQLFINLKTAKGLNLIIPPGVLAIADGVIE
jgi:putative ABC transport system substrate-binding protein